MSTFNGWTIIAMPSFPAAEAIQFNKRNAVAVFQSPFTGQQQTQDWGGEWVEMSFSLPPMKDAEAAAWLAFFLSLKGQTNVFAVDASWAGFLPAGVSGYWRLKSNDTKWSIDVAKFFGFQVDCIEAK